MHRFCRPIALLAASLMLAPSLLASARPKPAATTTTAPGTRPGRTGTTLAHRGAVRHFRTGVKLYQDGNYKGALAEFEAAYELKPGAPSLQNIALCLKALFRYSEAANTLERLLDEHGGEIDDHERAEVKAAIKELSSLVGSIVLHVTPASARVSVDGHAIDVKARRQGVRLNVGEHTVEASRTGYASVSRVVRVAGGQTRIPVDITLSPTMGFVSVHIDDPDAAIAVDGTALAFQHWSGPLTPGQHYVQVYKQGFKPFERRFTVKLGQTQRIEAMLGPPVAPGDSSAKKNDSAGEPSHRLRGWYGLVTLDLTGLSGDPVDTKRPSGQSGGGGAFGVRAGYRLWTPISIELLIQGGRYQVDGACVPSCDGAHVTRKYHIDSFRLGPDLRIMSGGETIRFTSAFGLGAVQHKVTFQDITNPNKITLPADVPPKDTEASGWDPYLLLEIGVQFNLGHVLLEGDAVADLDQASSIRYGDQYPYRGAGGLKLLGLSLRGGWSEWAPPARASKPARPTR